MAIVKEILDGLQTVAVAIKNIQTIQDAIKEGGNYLNATYPEAKQDLIQMINELQKTMRLIARASAVLTNFRFAISADDKSFELSRFNDYFIQHKGEADFLINHVDDLRGHCSKIREHGTKIGGSSSVEGFAKIFVKLGLRSPEREQDLAKVLLQLAHEDANVADSARIMVKVLRKSLDEIQNALGTGGMMFSENIPEAATLLSEYSDEFKKLEDPAREAAVDIQAIVQEL